MRQFTITSTTGLIGADYRHTDLIRADDGRKVVMLQPLGYDQAGALVAQEIPPDARNRHERRRALSRRRTAK